MGIDSINEELIKLRYELASNVIKNIQLKKDKIKSMYQTDPKYVVVPYDCISLLKLYYDVTLNCSDSCTILGMTVIKSKGCKNYTDITVY